MNKKNSKKRNQILIASVLYIVCIIIENSVAIPYYIALAMYALPYLIVGYEVFVKVAKNLKNKNIFDERFLMTLATIAAFVIGEHTEGAAAMIFYQVGELFENYAIDKSRKSISSLIDIMPEYVNLLTDDGVIKTDPDDVAEGSTIIVKPGEKIPIDGVIISGSTHLDTSAITGESKLSSAGEGKLVYSGSINCDGLISIKTTKSYENSTVSKIMELVEDASSQKAPAENFITKFARYYTPIVVILAIALSIISPLILGETIFEGIRRGCIFLVVSCPCALVISVPLSFFCGIGVASKKGILIKGGNYLDILSKSNTIVFDKTGTLTKGVFEVSDIQPKNNHDEIISIAALCEAYSNHPIALSIKKYFGKEIDTSPISEYTEIAGKGIVLIANGMTYLCGNSELMLENKINFPKETNAYTTIYVAKNGEYLGRIIISDSIRDESVSTLNSLKKIGFKKTVMLSGDSKNIANEIGAILQLDEVYSELLPHEKVATLEKIMKSNKNVIYTGDGINDAPVLMRADVGISMGSIGSDAAIEASDVVLVDDDISKLVSLIRISKKTVLVATFNIIFAISIKILILILGALGIANIWLAIFADVGVSVLAILNAMRILKVKKL